MTEYRREIVLFAIVGIVVMIILGIFGQAYTLRMLVEATCFAIIALGLTIQWGYAGLFNAGIMGFVAVGGFITMFLSFPINDSFWQSDAPRSLALFAMLVATIALVLFGLSQMHRIGISQRVKTALILVALVFAFFIFNSNLDPIARMIEKEAGFIGGLGLPVFVGWIVGGIAAAFVAYWIGRACLGLRSDYLAIATLGFAEIIKHILKNADWLTRGTLTVSPLPWPVPTPNDLGFITARAAYLSLTAVLVAVIFILLQRAYQAPWGRMMRAIRDNDIAAEAMGKNVNLRRLEIFVLGSGLIGFGGAALVSFNRIFDPSGFTPLKHTFLIWVMVLLGGAGNNAGAIFGAIAVYIIWVMSEPLTLFVFEYAAHYGSLLFGWEPPADLTTRALQSRVFVIGLTITLTLRFAPQGLLPERRIKVS